MTLRKRGRRVGLAALVAILAAACGTASVATEVGGVSEVRGIVSASGTDEPVAPSSADPATIVTASPEPPAGPPSSAPPSPVTTLAPLPVGSSQVTYRINGVDRSAVVVNPSPNGQARSLVVLLHGVGGKGAAMRSFGFEALATGSTVFVYPDGVGGYWNDGRPGLDPTPAPAPPDEIRFLSTLIDDMVARAGVASRKVALAGFSNGALMSGRAACELTDRISALVAVGGGGGADYGEICRPRNALSVLVVAGTSDQVVPFNGGQVADFLGKKRGRVESASDFFTFWNRAAGCAGSIETPVKAALPVIEIEPEMCAVKVSMSMYRVQGGSHDWFRISGFDTTKVAWDFLDKKAFAA